MTVYKAKDVAVYVGGKKIDLADAVSQPCHKPVARVQVPVVVNCRVVSMTVDVEQFRRLWKSVENRKQQKLKYARIVALLRRRKRAKFWRNRK